MGSNRAESRPDAGSPFRRAVLAAGAVAAVGAAAVWLARPAADPTSHLIASACIDCHNTTDWDGGFAFVRTDDTFEARSADGQPAAAIWERAIRKVDAGMMPPPGANHPTESLRAGFVAETADALDDVRRAQPDPGAEPLSRLNRTEYVNAIRDLLSFDASRIVDTLPADSIVADFDNIGEGLSVSPTLIEAYVGAALNIAREAVGDRKAVSTQIRYPAPARLAQDRHIDGLPLGTRGGFTFTHTFPLDAVYELDVATARRPGIATQSLCRAPEPTLAIDGNVVDVADGKPLRLPLTAGPHTFAAALVDNARCTGVNDLHDVYATGGGIRHVEIRGPFDATGPGDTPSRRAIFSCHPATPEAETACAKEIISRLATRAYRRPVEAGDPSASMLLDFYAAGRADGDFEAGIEAALARMLMSPQFIFQLEREPADVAPGQPYRLTDLEIATRLAFFLWSSIPDDELIGLAASGRLADRDVLRSQVARMLADPKASALVDNFAAQWLSLRELDAALPQDPGFDANLRAALAAETRLLFADVVADGSVLKLLDADYTYLNDRLAEHYGIAGVRGSYMRRVELPADSPRRGLIGQGSWLTATSVADRTSPVLRGKWFITHLLGAPVPTPPPGVEADLSDEAAIARADDTLRERLERHRANPTCAACHQMMDPIGLALENFDLIGRWREFDNGKPIDASGTLMDGTAISGPAALRAALLGKSDLFVTALTEKLLTYALGRVVDYRDMPAVRAIVRVAAHDDYRFDSLVLGIVESEPFQWRTRSAAGPVLAAADGAGPARAGNGSDGGPER